MKNDLSVQMIIYMLAAAAVACVFSYVLTPLVKRLAVRVHAVDVPKDARRMHTRAVPQLGGLAIAVSAFVVAGAAIWLLGSHGLGGVELGGLESGSLGIGGFVVGDSELRGSELFSLQMFRRTGWQCLALLVSFLIILSLGIVDDIVSLRASVKFLIQTVAALLVVLVGDLHIDILSVSLGRMGWLALPLGWLSYPVTMLWLLTLTNGYNFIDGIDGLACGTGCISSFSLLGIALLTGNTTVAVIFAALGGACLGFLPHNAHPAKVFMGDTGATFLGFVFGTLSIPVLFADQPKLPFLVPAMVFSLPLFDLCYAIIRRVRKGVSPFTADRGHFHHRLIDHGYSMWKTAAISWGFTAIECLAAVVAAGNTDLRPAALIIGLVVFITFACHIIRCGQKGS